MIEGLGIDIIEVKRVQKRIDAEKGFREYVFSSAEIAYCEKKTNKYEHYAARFAAKEAFLKAMGTGWTNDYSFHEIEITHDGQGKPLLALSGSSDQHFRKSFRSKITVSLTHLKETAAAVVILESL